MKISNKQLVWGIIGIVLVLGFIIWALTRKAFIPGLDYSATGNIGDTIGGITAPIIGIGGALLVYKSFQAQLAANIMQFNALEKEITRSSDETSRYERDRKLNHHLKIFDDIAQSLDNFEFTILYVQKTLGMHLPDKFSGSLTYKGINAIDQLLYRYENDRGIFNWSMGRHNADEIYSTESGLLYFKYMVANISILLQRVESNIDNKEDKELVRIKIQNFYEHIIEGFLMRIVAIQSIHNDKLKEYNKKIRLLLLLPE